jgi:hypothetical protein
MRWSQDPNQSIVDDLNNVRPEAGRHFSNKKKEYLKAKVDELDTNSKIMTCRGISDFKKGDQPRTDIVKDEKGVLVTDCHSILARWRDHFLQLFNVRGVNEVRQTEIHTEEPIVLELSAFEVEMAVEKIKRRRSPGTDQIPTEFITAGGRTIRCEVHKLTNSI